MISDLHFCHDRASCCVRLHKIQLISLGSSVIRDMKIITINQSLLQKKLRGKLFPIYTIAATQEKYLSNKNLSGLCYLLLSISVTAWQGKINHKQYSFWFF